MEGKEPRPPACFTHSPLPLTTGAPSPDGIKSPPQADSGLRPAAGTRGCRCEQPAGHSLPSGRPSSSCLCPNPPSGPSVTAPSLARAPRGREAPRPPAPVLGTWTVPGAQEAPGEEPRQMRVLRSSPSLDARLFPPLLRPNHRWPLPPLKSWSTWALLYFVHVIHFQILRCQISVSRPSDYRHWMTVPLPHGPASPPLQRPSSPCSDAHVVRGSS